MNNSLNLSFEGDDLRLRADYQLDNNGSAQISILIENENLTLLEMHALACEQAAQSLSKQAASFRRLLASTQASRPAAE